VPTSSLEVSLDLLAKRVGVLDAGSAMAEREQRIVRQEYFWRYGNTPRTRLHGELSMRLGLIEPALGWIIGTPATIDRFGPEEAHRFWQQHYLPQSMTLILYGAFDRAVAEEVARTTLGTIPSRSAELTGTALAPTDRGVPSAVTLSLTDHEVADPAAEYLAFYDLDSLDSSHRMRTIAALALARPLLAGGHRSVNADARIVNIWLQMKDRRWLELGVYVEAANKASRNQLVQRVTTQITRSTAKDVPAELIADIRKQGDAAWVVPADAPNADAVASWLSLKLTLEERGAYRSALKGVSAADFADLVTRLGRPDVTATGSLDPLKE
jgi:predicted Zn-dependent peptidase